MKNIKTLSTLILTAAVIATAQTVNAETIMTGDTGLGVGLGGAVIDSYQGGYTGCDLGPGSASLGFEGDAVVNWSALNLNSGETLNFNAVNGASGLTVLNTVSGGMSTIYGNINANEGIGHLIISNPNGMLFDGATFTTAADCDLTLNATPMYGVFNGDKLELVDRRFTPEEIGYDYNPWRPGYNAVKIELRDSDFTVGGDLSIVAPSIKAYRSTFGLNDGKGTLKLSTADGSMYITGWITGNTSEPGRDDQRALAGMKSINLHAIEVDGNVEIVVTDNSQVAIHEGGHITGNLNIDSNDCVDVNMYNSDTLFVDGDIKIVGDGEIVSLNDTVTKGNVDLYNKSGIVEIKNVNAGKNIIATADAQNSNTHNRKSEIWVDGEIYAGGDVVLNAVHNILIGNNRGDNSGIKVRGNIAAHAQDGHVMVTGDLIAGENISLKSDNYNILTDGKATLKAKTYDFYSNGYIGGLGTYRNGDKSQDLRSVVETYTFIPSLDVYTENGILIASETVENLSNNGALIVNGGTITNLVANYAKIDSLNDLTIEHANIGEDMRISAIDSNLDLSSDDIHAKVIYVGDKTDSLTIADKARDFLLTFFNIHNGDRHGAGAIRPNEVVTSELADAHNTPKEGQERAEDTTELKFVATSVDPVNPPVDPVDPVNPVDPSTIDGSDNVKLLNSMNNDLLSQATDAAPVNTPTAYAADLDDDDNTSAPIRQNVDGSVTIVKEMAAGK